MLAAEGVAVQQRDAPPGVAEHLHLVHEAQAGACREDVADQEIAIAVGEGHLDSGP